MSHCKDFARNRKGLADGSRGVWYGHRYVGEKSGRLH